MSPAAIYKTMAEEKPTVFFDEAETLNSESANIMRSILNMGYRKGQVVRRVIGKEVMEYEVYCPKVFILIGDVYDTLRDRSIIVRMVRAEPRERFVYEPAKFDGRVIRELAAQAIEDNRSAILDAFTKFQGIKFLTDRDEEIWTPLFVMCQTLAPHRMKELQILSVDMSTEKTADARQYHNLLGKGAEKVAQDDEYAKQLLTDLAQVINGARQLPTMDCIEALRALPTSPWRKYRGEGLTFQNAADMLSRFGVHPVNLSVGHGRKNRKVVRGYKLADVKAAINREIDKMAKDILKREK
jgi:hypothetical protein